MRAHLIMACLQQPSTRERPDILTQTAPDSSPRTLQRRGGPYISTEAPAFRPHPASARPAASSSLRSRPSDQVRGQALKRLQPFGLGDVHAAEPGLPVLEGRFRDPVLARQIGGLRAGLVRLQQSNDLLFREACWLFQSVLIRVGLQLEVE